LINDLFASDYLLPVRNGIASTNHYLKFISYEKASRKQIPHAVDSFHYRYPEAAECREEKEKPDRWRRHSTPG